MNHSRRSRELRAGYNRDAGESTLRAHARRSREVRGNKRDARASTLGAHARRSREVRKYKHRNRKMEHKQAPTSEIEMGA